MQYLNEKDFTPFVSFLITGSITIRLLGVMNTVYPYIFCVSQILREWGKYVTFSFCISHFFLMKLLMDYDLRFTFCIFNSLQ